MASEAVGGLYVAVGVDADKAINDAKRLNEQMARIARSINALGSAKGIDQLTAKMERLAAASAKANSSVAGAAAKATAPARATAPVGAAAAAVTETKELERLRREQERVYAQAMKQRDLENKALIKSIEAQAVARSKAAAAEAASQKEIDRLRRQQEQVYAQLLRERQADNRALMASVVANARARGAAEAAASREAEMAERAAVRAREQEQRNLTRVTEVEARKREQAEQAYQKRLEQGDKQAAARRAALAKQAAASQGAVGRAYGSAGQEFLVGLGAARSGNYFYGLAAAARGAKNINSELGMIPVAARGAAIGVAAIGVAAVAAGIGVGILAKKIADIGFQGAADLQMLQIQFEGLLGSAQRAKAETDFLIALGKESIIPTQALFDADRQLLAFGVTADNTRRGLVQFASDFGTATGKSAEQIYYLNLALGQVAAIGKANTIDLRQLANVGVSTAAVYEIIGEKIGKSAQFVAENVSEGIVSAPMLFAALQEYGKRFEETADKARLSTKGLLSNIKDQIQFGFGQAFLGANDIVSKSLERVMELVKKINFKAIGDAFAASLVFIKDAFAGIDFDGIVRWFNTWFPRAVKVAGAAVGGLVIAFRSLVGIVNIVVRMVQALIQGVVQGIVFTASVGNNVLDFLGQISDEQGAKNRAALDQIYADTETTLKDLAKEVEASAYDIAAIWSKPSVKGLFLEVQYGGPVGSADQLERQALANQVKPVEIDWAKEFAKWQKNSKSGGGGGESPAETAAKEMIARMKELVDKAKNASESLAQALVVPFRSYIEAQGGQIKSAAEEAFTSGDLKTIIQQFTDLKQNIIDFYAPFEDPKMAGSKKVAQAYKNERKALIDALTADTKELLTLAAQRDSAQRQFAEYEKQYNARLEELAKQKEALTAQYEAQKKKIATTYDDYYTAVSATEGKFVKGAITVAQEALDAAKEKYDAAKAKLDELRAARDEFLNSLAESIRGYVNKLEMVTKEIQTYTRLDEAGSFSLSTEKQADLAAFRQGLNDRLEALRTYRAQVAQLAQAGLNSDLLKNIVSQGPESTKDLVASLAGASAADIADINRVQTELAAQITGFQREASAQWFDAGIAAQEAFTAPLKAAYDSAQNQVNLLNEQKALALGVLETWYADQNAAIAAQEAAEKAVYDRKKAELEAVLTENEKKAAEVATRIQGRLDKIPTGARNTGIATMQGLIDGMKAKEKDVVAEAERIANRVASTIRNALKVQSPSKVMYEIGKNVTEGLALGMQSNIDSLETSSALLTGAISSTAASLGPVTQEPPLVKVFIGDRELTDIVDVQISEASRADRDLVIAGRRY